MEHETETLPDFLTVAEVARAARLAERTIRNRIAQGKLPRPTRFAGRVRFERGHVLAWLRGELDADTRKAGS